MCILAFQYFIKLKILVVPSLNIRISLLEMLIAFRNEHLKRPWAFLFAPFPWLNVSPSEASKSA